MRNAVGNSFVMGGNDEMESHVTLASEYFLIDQMALLFFIAISFVRVMLLIICRYPPKFEPIAEGLFLRNWPN